METSVVPPLLSRVKSWQLVGLGISGWCTLYSVAVLTWGTSSLTIGNAQGGCFAATMTLASVEARRYKCKKATPIPEDPMQWISSVSTEHLTQTIAQTMQLREFRLEPCHALETELGFGVRAISAGRTMVFETSHWRKAVIDELHAQTTEENRKRVAAARAIIVCAGKPDEGALTFAKTHAVSFLADKELKDMFTVAKPVDEKAATAAPPKPSLISRTRSFVSKLRSDSAASKRKKAKQRRWG